MEMVRLQQQIKHDQYSIVKSSKSHTRNTGPEVQRTADIVQKARARDSFDMKFKQKIDNMKSS